MFLPGLGSGLGVLSVPEHQTAWLSKKCCEKVVLVCRSHSQKVLWMVFAGLFVCFWFFVCFCFLSSSYFPTPPSLFFCTRKYQEWFIRSCPATRAMSQVCRKRHGPDVCSLQGLCRQPSTCEGSLQSDVVGLITKNLKYCRCGVADLPGSLSHIPRFGTAGELAYSSVNQGRRVLLIFLQVGNDSSSQEC